MPLLKPQKTAAVDRGRHLSADEERRLIRRWQRLGDRDALARVIAAHQGAIWRLAFRFQYLGVAIEDLVQEGNLALVHAANGFDARKGTRFMTYATYWIRARLFHHVFTARAPVRIGTTRGERSVFFGLARAQRKLERDGERASASELARELRVKVADVEVMLPRLRSRDVFLDARFNGEPTLQLVATEPTPEEKVIAFHDRQWRNRVLKSGMARLDPREQRIISARCLCNQPATLQSIGRELHLSRERVRQIELRAKTKLKTYARAKLDSSTRSLRS